MDGCDSFKIVKAGGNEKKEGLIEERKSNEREEERDRGIMDGKMISGISCVIVIILSYEMTKWD
jgi:hypothetical protein